ncbi:MAG: neutral/alkaline non-lysosomal ceramidase N-terminal domain-containing protein, partial [Panacagrimonas sp.]
MAWVLVVSGCGDGPHGNFPDGAEDTPAFADATRAQCTLRSPLRQVGAGLDAPGRLEAPLPAALGSASGTCGGNTRFRFGSGLYDVTGVVAYTGGSGWESPTQVFRGLHQRQYARAYAFDAPCNGKRLMFVSADIGLMYGSLRVGVLDAIAADPELSRFYSGENLMLSATHTHSGPAGYSHHEAGNALHLGYDATVYTAIVNGLVESIRLAHANLQAHPETASVRMAIGELLDTNINRSKPAFLQNSEAERLEFQDSRGEPVQVDKRVVQLNLVRGNGSAVGIVNWFGVHPTTIGPTQHFVSSDNKGYAALGFERVMKTRYEAAPGVDTFVAAFAQTDEGDSSPNLFIEQFPHPDPARGGGADDFESNAIAGTKQLARALELYSEGASLSGPLDYRFFQVQMNQVEVTDPVVLAGLRHPPALDTATKRTCAAALGVSFPAGAEDGPSPTGVEGVNCDSSPQLIEDAVNDFTALSSFHVPASLVSTLLLCNVTTLPLLDLGCQAEKPVLLPLNLGEVAGGALSDTLEPLGLTTNFEPAVLPFQLFRLGNLAIVGLPWEVTTMSARRLRKTVLEVLAPAGVDTVVIPGLANDYVHYLTTREEYASQQYEGASTIFGPWSLAAVQQETRKLAIAMRDGVTVAAGPAYPRITPLLIRPPYLASDIAISAFGSLVTDVPASAAPGDTVRAEFQAGHPRNDLRTQASYVYAERQSTSGAWEVVAQDRDPELFFEWNPTLPSPLPIDPPLIGPSTAAAIWHIPANAAPGIYRLRHVGAAQSSPLS